MKNAIIAVELAAIGNQSGGFTSFPVWEAISKWMAYSIPACSANISSQVTIHCGTVLNGRLLVVMLWFYRARKARHEGGQVSGWESYLCSCYPATKLPKARGKATA
jgi:hypothetical protein